jgi:WD40 repeat protein
MLHGPKVEVLRLAADGKSLLSCDAREVRLWDVSTGRLLQHIPRRALGSPLVLLPDASVLYFNERTGHLYRLDMHTGKLREGELMPKGWLLDLAGSDNGKLVAVNARDEAAVLVYGWEQGKRIARLPAETEQQFRRFVFSPDGSLLVGTSVTEVAVWEIRTQKQVAKIKLPPVESGTPITPAFSPDGKVLALSGQERLRLHDPRTLEERKEFRVKVYCRQIAFSADGNELIGISEEKELLRWSLKGGPLPKLGGEAPRAMTTAAGLLAVAGESGQIRVFNLATGKEQPVPQRQAGLVAVVCNTSGQAVTAAEDGQVVYWDLKEGREIRRVRLPVRGPMTLSPDGKYICWREKEDLLVHDAASGKRLLQVEDTTGVVAFSFDGRLMLTAGEGTGYRLWNLPRKSVLRDIEEVSQLIVVPDPITFAPDGRSFASSDGGTVKIHEVATGRPRMTLFFPTIVMEDRNLTAKVVRYSRDGKTLILIREGDENVEGDLNVFSMTTLELVCKFSRGAGDVFAVSPDGRWLARTEGLRWRIGAPDSGLTCDINLHDLRGRNPLRPHLVFRGHEGSVTALEFTPDGKCLVSGGKDGTALVWDVARATAPKQPRLPNEKLLAEWWDLLGAMDPPESLVPMVGFEVYPELSIPLFKAHLKPAEGPPPGRVAALIHDLEARKFATRQQALRELEILGALAEPELEAVLEGKPGLELATRVEKLLEKLSGPITDADRLRELRAVEVLERIGTAEARAVLEGMAKGHPGARLTREAKASLERLWGR